MHKFDSTAIAELARQLKRGPTRLRLRQLLNIEFLLSVVESAKGYPADFVCHALTGYRAPAILGNAQGAELIDGDVLIADLVTLAEQISEDADLSIKHWSGLTWSIAELAERFGVSTKTIFRWRRRGLAGWKFRFPDRRKRVVFTDRCIRRFVAGNVDLIHRGSSFSQLSKTERQHIIEHARHLYNGRQTTVNAVAKKLASEAGRAVETIRLILKAYDDAHPGAGIFNRSKLDVAIDDQRLAVWEAHQDGASVETLARRFDRSKTAVYRIITQMRARELRTRKVEFMPSDEFSQIGAEDSILKDPVLSKPYQDDLLTPHRIPKDLPPYLRQLFHNPLLSKEGEASLFRKMNYLKFRADRRRRDIDPDSVRAAELDRIEALLDEAGRVKNQIVQSNLRLVVSIAKRHIGCGIDFFEIISDGNISLMRAIDKFDYTRGFKFSTYASWAIMRNYARIIPEHRYHQDRYQTGREELLDLVVGPLPDEVDDEHVAVIRGMLERMLNILDERESNILRQRFGLDEYGHPQTLEQIGRRFGVSKERVRQLEARAMGKLRDEFEVDAKQLLGT
ncbi:MAG: sigma-70 family RNA polymerase sigma factor [Planctomycetota bacterium]